MYPTSEDYKERILNEKQALDIYVDGELLDERINSFKVHLNLFTNNEFCLGCTPQVEITFEVYKQALQNSNIKEIYVETGLEDEKIPLGYFNVKSCVEVNDFLYEIKAVDDMEKFEEEYDGSDLTYPKTLLEVLQDICNKKDVELGSTSFLNCDKQIAVYDNTVKSRTYLSFIAEQAGGIAYIGRDKKLYIKSFGVNGSFDINKFRDFKFRPLNPITKIVYEDGIQDYKIGNNAGSTVYINANNTYIVDRNQIENIYNFLNGLELSSFEGTSIIDPAFEIADIITIDGKNILFQGDLEYKGKFVASIKSKFEFKSKAESMQTKQSNSTKFRKVQSLINQQEGKIETLVAESDEQNTKIAKVTQTVDELNSKISDLVDITTYAETSYASVDLDGINESEPIMIKVHPNLVNISYFYPNTGFFPGLDVFLRDRKIRFHNKSTNEEFDYLIPDDLLYYNSSIYDEFYLDYESQTCQVIKRCGYNADGTVYALNEEIVTNYPYPSIPLTDGDYTVSLVGYNYGYIMARLVASNIYTSQFVTKVEMNSSISQKANEINATVALKLDNKEFTHASIVARINDDTSQILIEADKINISASNVIDILAGSTLNLKSKNISITSDNFSVTPDGTATMKNANITGTFTNYDSSGYLAIKISQQVIDLYDWKNKGVWVGNLSSTYRESNQQSGIALACALGDDILFGYKTSKNDTTINPIIQIDTSNLNSPIWIKGTVSGTIFSNNPKRRNYCKSRINNRLEFNRF